MTLLKVSKTSKPKSVAGAIAGILREEGKVDVQAIGAGAVNQAVKAIAVAKSIVLTNGEKLICVPNFTEVMIDGENRSAIRFEIEKL